jgi:GNAT superfamily N-acetyltransferase
MPAVPLTLSQLKPAAALMARAFYSDPFFSFVVPDVTRRGDILAWLFEKIIFYGIHYGKVYTTAAIEGVAIWLGPGYPGLTLPGIMRSGLFLLPFRLKWHEFTRSTQLANFAEQLHKRTVAGRHWYLYELGVDPSVQGQGVGRTLLQPVLGQACQEGMVCYLDTYNEKNLPFYERNGFTIADQGQVNPASPQIWALRFDPSDESEWNRRVESR